MINEYNNYDDCFKMVTQPSNCEITFRKAACRTSVTSKRMRSSIQTGGTSGRAQTSDVRHRKIAEDVWKTKLNTKMDDIMTVANTFYKKCQ